MLVELHLVVCHVMWLLRIQVLLHVLQERRLSASQCLWSGPVLCCVYAHCSAGIPTGTCWIELQEMQFATKYPPTRPPVFIASWNTHKGDQPPSEAVVPEAQWRTEVTGHRPDFKRPPTAWFVVIWYEKLHLITKIFSERLQSDSEEPVHPSRPDCFFSPDFLPLNLWLVTQLCSVCILTKLFISFSLRFNQIIQRAPTCRVLNGVCWCSSKKVSVVLC